MISSLLRGVVNVLFSRAFWTCVGFLIAAALIWFAGPLLAFGSHQPLVTVEARLWTILALAAFLLLRVLWRRWRRSSTNASITERLRGLLQTTSRSGETEEIRLLRSRFDEALEMLRRVRFGECSRGLGRLFSRGRYLYELPWYILIGAPGAGKTTALLNSGLEFPLAKSFGKGAVKGVGGTRNCDWWFTNQAVLIDTAGRYTTHDSDAEGDRAEWRGFLDLLRKSRSLQPINGVLLTVSVTELLDSSPEARRGHAEILRQRLDELRDDLGVRFPVYLLVSKCDLLSGFDEYFASLDRAGREQVWGFTLPWSPEEKDGYADSAVEHELSLLRSRIHAGLVDTLLSEPELARRARIHSFPQQFALLCEALREVGAILFADSRFSSAPLLRGMYFTSATQEGTPLDRVIRAMDRAPQGAQTLAVQRSTAKSYFLNELLAKVVFAEANLVGHNRRADRRARALQLAGHAASVLVLAVVVTAWGTSYRNNTTYLVEVDGKVDRLALKLDELPPMIDGNVYPLLAPLTEAETVPDSVHFRAAHPLRAWTFGLYQGDKLLAGSRPLYENLLRTRLAPAIEARLEWLLRTVAVEDLEFSYEILKAYLMLHDRAHFDGDAFTAFVLTDWDYNMPAGAARQERDALARHVAALIAIGGMQATKPVDSTLVDATRARLTQYSFAQRTYRRLVRALEHNKLPDFSIGAVVGPSAPAVFRRTSGLPLTDGVSALYTYRGYHDLFAPEVDNVLRYVGRDDAWVLGVSDVSAREQAQAIANGELALEVKRLYMWDYVAVWERFIKDIDLLAPRSLPEATELVKVLSSADSPLARLMKAVAEETTLLKTTQNSGAADPSLLDRMKRSARATQDGVTRMIGPNMLPGRLGPEEKPELIVDRRFEALRRSVGSGEGGGPLAGTLQALSELHLLLSSVEAARTGGYPPPSSDLPARLKAEASRLPPPSKRLLETLAATGGTLVAREARAAKSTQMVGTVTRVCRETIEGRYPFVAGAKKEVASEDFTRMFGPGGIADSYFQRELAAVVDTSTSPWHLVPGARGGLGEGGVLGQFERAA
ncbi:MAG: type VI secretion system membrane subunit TssM, partial [Zoogloeaceae bacterium]|nr:type VI secretion system membrane subunit TssM [Zoogloeaceae bacterium]